MNGSNLAEDIYVHRDLFDEREEKNQAVADRNMEEIRGMFADIHGEIKALRADVHSEISEFRTETKAEFKAVRGEISELRSKTEAEFKEIRGEIKSLRSEMKNEINVANIALNAKIGHVDDTLSTAIAGLIDRFDDMRDYQNKWFSVFGILFGVLAVAFTVIAFFK